MLTTYWKLPSETLAIPGCISLLLAPLCDPSKIRLDYLEVWSRYGVGSWRSLLTYPHEVMCNTSIIKSRIKLLGSASEVGTPCLYAALATNLRLFIVDQTCFNSHEPKGYALLSPSSFRGLKPPGSIPTIVSSSLWEPTVYSYTVLLLKQPRSGVFIYTSFVRPVLRF